MTTGDDQSRLSDFATMPLPAVCPDCGAVFPSGFGLGSAAHMVVEGCRSGPCPGCGGVGLVPDGAYTIVEQVLAYSRDADMSREQMLATTQLLGDAIGPGGVVDLEMLERRIPAEVPAAAWVLALLRDPAVGNVAQWLALVFAVLVYAASK